MKRHPDQDWADARYNRLVQYAGAKCESEMPEDTSDLDGTGLCFETTERDLQRMVRNVELS